MSSQPPYLVDHRRGEVNELKSHLANPKIKDKRDVIKRVIAYMTLGIDVSKLYSEMVKAASTSDPVQKKMVYQYLCTYAQQKPDIALLCINTLQKDCRDQDPMIRGLALRSLCSLRLQNIGEYSLPIIRNSFKDVHPYVRKTAIMGCAKLFRFSPNVIKGSDVEDILYNMLKDKDASVAMNAILALNEILASEGKMAVNRSIILYLLNRLDEFPEWGQCAVLDLIEKYTPQDEDEMFGIMDILDQRLKHSNSAVVLAATNAFLSLTRDDKELFLEVLKRLKSPLLTLMASGTVEITFVILAHIKILVSRAPGVFDNEFKHFYCRYFDPPSVKKLKLEVVTLLANAINAKEILNELSEYVSDANADIVRASIQAVGKIALSVNSCVDDALEHLLSYLDYNTDYISTEAVMVCRDLLRKYPERYEDVLPALKKVLKDITETAGKAAVIWMIGEYGDTINEAPYILEPLIDGWDEETSATVKSELLTATMKLFFKRPPELQFMLGRVLRSAVSEVNQIDVRDRALFYYRLLKQDVQEAARIVNCPKVVVDSFIEQENKEFKEKLFNEFNSLSVIYNIPEERFSKLVLLTDEEKEEKKEEVDMGDKDRPLSSAGEHVDGVVDVPMTDGGSSSTFEGGSALYVEEAKNHYPSLRLSGNPQIDSERFENVWTNVQEASEVHAQSRPVFDAGAVEKALTAHGIFTMASGNIPGEDNGFKFYMYAQEENSNVSFFIECLVSGSTGNIRALVKVDGNTSSLDEFHEILKQALSSI